MLALWTLSFCFFFVSTILGVLAFIIAKKKTKLREKMSPFECGFDPLSVKSLSFSLRFFTISILFLIFDVEIALILPISANFSTMNNPISLFSFLSLILILWASTIQEWNTGAFTWKT